MIYIIIQRVIGRFQSVIPLHRVVNLTFQSVVVIWRFHSVIGKLLTGNFQKGKHIMLFINPLKFQSVCELYIQESYFRFQPVINTKLS